MFNFKLLIKKKVILPPNFSFPIFSSVFEEVKSPSSLLLLLTVQQPELFVVTLHEHKANAACLGGADAGNNSEPPGAIVCWIKGRGLEMAELLLMCCCCFLHPGWPLR